MDLMKFIGQVCIGVRVYSQLRMLRTFKVIVELVQQAIFDVFTMSTLVASLILFLSTFYAFKSLASSDNDDILDKFGVT